jgi:excisionase family DNA binding protein
VPPDLDGLPPALTTAQAAEVLNVSPDTLERAAKRGDAPVPHYRAGRALRWPREPIRALLGLAPNGNGAPAGAPSTEPVYPPTADQAGRRDP